MNTLQNMEVTREALVRIVCQASTINERLGSEFHFREAQANNALINSRLQKWCQRVVQGNQEEFEKRLAWDGLNLNILRLALGSVSMADNQPLPAWVETLKSAMQVARASSLEVLENGDYSEYHCLDPQDPIPFEEVFLPFVDIANKKLIPLAGSSYSLLSETAHATLERSLLSRLSQLGSQAMELKFSIFRTFQQSPLTSLIKPLESSVSKERYREFIRAMLTGKLLLFFQEYSVLARLLAVATDLWVDAIGEFICRLASDWSEIQQAFQGEKELGQVVAVEPDLSDPHNKGRTAISLRFTSGLRLIYKPKDLGTEQAYFKLLSWFNDHGAPLPFKLLKVLNRSTHGWVEFVEHLPCQDQAEANRYYQRAGMLLCVVYALQGTDCHAENIIACGEHPMLVDMEALMHHQVREVENLGAEVGAQMLAIMQLGNSVLRTGLLPRWEFGQDMQVAYDVSGLGGFGQQDRPFRVQKWKNINTDSMSLRYEDGGMLTLAKGPSLDGVNLSLGNYVEELIAGFQQMYQFLLEQRNILLATDSPLATLAHQRVRFIFRSTNIYAFVLQKTLHPKFLRDGADRSIELDILSRALLAADSKPFIWPILKAEQQALEQLDIPYFIAYSDSDALTIAPNQVIETCFTKPSYDLMVSHLNQLSNEDLEQQISFIRGLLYSRTAIDPRNSLLSEKVELNVDTIAPLTREVIVQQAMAIAAELQQRAIRSADGSITWISLAYIPEAEKFQLQPMDYGLYEGCSGVALFLAALETVTGGAGFRSLVLEALQSLRKHLQKLEDSQKFAKEIGIGGAMGLGSIIYALVRISQFLGEPDLLEDAKQFSSLLSPELLAADQKFDIISGAAGAILGLLGLYNITADSAVLERAITCGHHLLSHRITGDSGYRAWATLNGKLLTGFSHGAAGIAYALLRLYETTQSPIFLQAAEEAIGYERSVFSPEAGNWPDFRPLGIRDGKPTFMATWCHGAPGIALARLGSLAILDTEEIRQEIEIALKTTQKYDLHGMDHLCCGTLGRVEVLLTAALQLSKIELLETAQKQAALVVDRAEQVGSFCLLPGFFTNIYIPSFFQGTAGIGYELLRLAHPDLLPSVLLWE
ncbi:MAG: type 2 lanthipeptide synthetase LanM family protein [Coleofasciculus chthonoplastes F3-SA18-01]|jgi:type 2 lantibiotic biosynthesis protein LanM|uniref:type 2 lanthipeptide synthetase LanM family protein n=1 Tax=Coleofasciculus chthonoplastes TaxID=64178 RepID=UPI003301A5FA